MKNFLRTVLLALITNAAFHYGCNDSGTGPIVVKLESLGFEDKTALRLVLSEPYLYVCAGSDGLWRRDIRRMITWEFLGLSDSTLGRHTNVGVLDVDIISNDILVAYNGSSQRIKPDSTVAIWRSINGGQNWFRSDSGIVESRKYPEESNIINSLQRSTSNPDVILAIYGPAIYQSNDRGAHWNIIHGNRGVFVNKDYVRWNPYQAGQAWFYGETALFEAYLFRTSDFGESFTGGVDFTGLGFPSGNAVTDIAFDIGNPRVSYAATYMGIVKSTDGGIQWQALLSKEFIFRLVGDPRKPQALFLAGGTKVYSSLNGAETLQLVAAIPSGFIESVALDLNGAQLFVGTNEGIYALQLRE